MAKPKARYGKKPSKTRSQGWAPLILLALIAAVVIYTKNRPKPPSTEAAGTRRMVTLLTELAQKADPAVNIYLNEKRAQWLEGKLRPDLTTTQRLELRTQIALEQLRAGNPELSINSFQKAVALVESLSDTNQALLRSRLDWYLGLAYLRLGEQQNCVARHSSDSCLVPIAGNGIHTETEGAEGAVEYLTKALETNPRDLAGIWLLNLAYMNLGRYPDDVPRQWFIPPEAFQSEYDIGRFRDVAPAVDVAATGRAGGVVMEDLDGDGLLDILCSSWGLLDQIRLFINNGDGSFTEKTSEAKLKGVTGGINLVQADYNNDGLRDVLVLRGGGLGSQGNHPNSLLRNNGNDTFDDVTEQAGLASFHPTQTAAWADYDRDGWLDLFIGNESDGTNTHPCELYHNNGDGSFTECALDRGLAHVGMVKGVAWGDYDNDGRPDLYLSCWGESNVLFRNLGPSAEPERGTLRPWKFTNVTAMAGVALPLDSAPCWFFDYDQDGFQDLFVASYGSVNSMEKIAADYLKLPVVAARPRLYRNTGNGSFTNVTEAVNLSKVLVTAGANFGDLDNDGFPDLYLGTGDPNLATLAPNRMFRNNGGQGFQDVTTSGGFGHIQKTHGIAFGDLDQDGDQDLYTVLGGCFEGDLFPNALFANPGRTNNWITLRLIGSKANRDAIGARVEVKVKQGSQSRTIHQTVSSGGSFGASSLQMEIGLGKADSIESLNIRWPSRTDIQTLQGVPLNRILEIRQGEDGFKIVASPAFKLKGLETPAAAANQ